MRKLFASTLALAAISCGSPFYTLACEKHAHSAESAPLALPGGSLYHLNSKWKNNNNTEQKFAQFAGKPRLMAMVFTRCQTACPALVQSIKEIDTGIAVDLFSFDSGRENPKTMQEFMRKYRLDGNRWSVHTSSANQVAELAAAMGVQYKKLASGDYIHSNIIFLVDKNGEIVAKKEGLNSNDQAFADAIKKLTAAP